jgi:class 3 adenylate cyclase/TolB-like protein/tetratricopeptide (TPR) repeat protein
MSETRKLAAILVADVVGYSRLAGADEDRVLARLRTLRSDLIDPIISVHHGCIVKRTGDGSIIEFRSVVDAVRCAIEVQTGMAERNAGVPPEKRIEYRVGIHLGDVVEESDGDLMGDGVNIAARLEGIAKPGAICLSEQAYWQVKGRLEMAVSDLGATRLKNIAEPIHVYSLEVGQPAQTKPGATVPAAAKSESAAAAPKTRARLSRWSALGAALAIIILAAGALAWRAGYTPRFMPASADDKLANAPRLSIVVLPFENLSGDKEQDYFADGITEDLTTDLSHLSDSFVISRSTAFAYKGKPVDPKEIGKELGVRYVLEGSVRRAGEMITINAQLISTETGAHVWADRFEGERSKLGELQVEAVSRLANSLGVELVRAEALRAMRERPNDPDAVDLAMRGKAMLNGAETLVSTNEEIGLFEHALSLDPNNIQAQLGLGWSLSNRAQDFPDDNAAGDLARAEETIDRVLTLQPDNSSAHYAKSLLYGAKHQWGPAIAEAEKAIADNRNNAAALAIVSYYKMFLGHAEDGFADVEAALRLSPRDEAVRWWQYFICHFHSHLAQWEQAIEWCDKSIASGNPSQWPYIDLAAAHTWLGHMKEAKEAAAQALKIDPGFTIQGTIDHPSDDPTFNAQLERILVGARKAGIPEGEAKTN